ncbi:MAG: hypothetical protein ACRDFB_02800 [Rhabdochlamydiaceae bacterium]
MNKHKSVIKSAIDAGTIKNKADFDKWMNVSFSFIPLFIFQQYLKIADDKKDDLVSTLEENSIDESQVIYNLISLI